jgi:glycosyltransferase involved in cell wall biosynthesis
MNTLASAFACGQIARNPHPAFLSPVVVMLSAPNRAVVSAAPKTAVVIPCLNEAEAIAKVVRDYQQALPGAHVYVIDNASTDQTGEVARSAGATVIREPLRGKGNAVRRAFADIDADLYVLVDGDDTYDPAVAPVMVKELQTKHLDMVTGVRRSTAVATYRPGHRFGNRLLTGVVRWIFGDRITDMLSGYRVFSRRFVKSFPALAEGFETETEFTVHALELRLPVAEVETAYRVRFEGTTSKLRTWSDGFRILSLIIALVKHERPLQFFSWLGCFLAVLGVVLGTPIVIEFSRTGLVPRLPTAVLATGIELMACLSMVSGLILDSVSRGRKELKRLAYLSQPTSHFE